MIEYHRRCLEDRERVERFRRALHEQISPGDVVADIGSGTGIFACFAAQVGARRVYAVELDDFSEIARQIVADNGLSDRITCIQADASTLQLDEPVDLVFGDMIGVAGVDLQILSVFKGFCERNLKPTGGIMPAHFEVHCAPWEDAEAWAPMAFWSGHPYGLDFSACHRLETRSLRTLLVDPAGQLAESALFWHPYVGRDDDLHLEHNHTFRVTRAGSLHGFALWFKATLTGDIQICTHPDEPAHVWKQGFIPMPERVEVQPGDHIELHLSATRGDRSHLWGWSGVVRRAQRGDHPFKAHIIESLPISRPMLEILKRDRLPTPSRHARLVAEVTQAMLTGGSARAVAARLMEAHPGAFGGLDEALGFVARTAAENA